MPIGFPPGASDDPVPPASDPIPPLPAISEPVGETTRRISSDLETVYQTAIDEVRQSINNDLEEVDHAYQTAVVETTLPIQTELQAIQGTYAKAANQILRPIRDELNSAYVTGISEGLPIPSYDVIQAVPPEDDPLPWNWVQFGPGGPYTENWPTQLLGEDPFNPSSTSTAGLPSSTDTASYIQSVSGTDVPPNLVCPPGQVLRQFDDGTWHCVTPEYAAPPPPIQCPQGSVPVQIETGIWRCVPINSGSGDGGGGSGGGGSGGGGGSNYCNGLVLYQDVGHLSGRSVTCTDQNVTMWEYIFRTGDAEWINYPIGATPTPTYLFEGHIDTMNFGAKIVNRNYCVLGGENIPQGCIPQSETPPPVQTIPTPTPSDQCPIETPKIRCKPGDALYGCVQPLADKLSKDYHYNRTLPVDLQSRIAGREQDVAFVEAEIWQYATDDCAKKKGIKNASEYSMLCGFDRYKPINWCLESALSQVDTFISSLPQNASDFAKSFCVWQFEDKTWYPNSATKWLYDLKLVPDAIPDAINGIFYSILSSTYSVITSISDSNNPKSKPALVADAIYSIAKTLNRTIGFPPDSWVKRLEYTVNSLAPVEIPSPAEVNSMFMGGEIDVSQYYNMIGAHNLCPDWMVKVLNADRTRPDVRDSIQLWMRQKITDLDLRKRMRDLGVLNDQDYQAWKDLFEALPGVSDVIRFMLRDVADPKAVSDYGLDDEFEQKYQGLLRYYGDAQGISTDLARYYWRSHWQFPSPTQLYEMLHRLRPGRVDASMEVDADLVEKTLGINDYAPIWRKRLMAISYNPLTRVDTQRAYFIGAIDREEVKNSYLDGGYNEDNADRLTRFTDKLKQNYVRGQVGALQPKDYVTRYVKGLISELELRRQLSNLDIDDERVDMMVDVGRQKRSNNMRDAFVGSTRKLYLRRDIDEQEAINMLVANGGDLDSANYLIDLWKNERIAKSKFVTGKQLCTLRERGLIDDDAYRRGLFALGYTVQDVQRVGSLCDADISERQLRRIKQALTEQERKQEKSRRDAEKQAKAKASEAEKQRKAEEKLVKDAQTKEEKEKAKRLSEARREQGRKEKVMPKEELAKKIEGEPEPEDIYSGKSDPPLPD